MLGWFLDRFRQSGVESILDIGCGIGRHTEHFEMFPKYLGVDLVKDYLVRAINGSNLMYVQGDATKLDELFLPKSFDAVLWYDSLEHLTKEQGLQSVKYTMEIARKSVGVYTPEGFFEQTDNVWGGDARDAQVHKSGWSQEDLSSIGFQEIEIEKANRRGHGLVSLILALRRTE